MIVFTLWWQHICCMWYIGTIHIVLTSIMISRYDCLWCCKYRHWDMTFQELHKTNEENSECLYSNSRMLRAYGADTIEKAHISFSALTRRKWQEAVSHWAYWLAVIACSVRVSKQHPSSSEFTFCELIKHLFDPARCNVMIRELDFYPSQTFPRSHTMFIIKFEVRKSH